MATLDCAFQIKFSNQSFVKIIAIKYRTNFNRCYLFEINDQPVDLHPEFSIVLKSKKNIKNGAWYGILLQGSLLDRYFDRVKQRFWFNGKHLKPENEEEEDSGYDPSKYLTLHS